MLERILKNWTITRGLYLVIGVLLIVQSAWQQEWFGVLFGGYFASMGLFAFGCAAGNCAGGSCAREPSAIQDVDVREQKVK